MRCLQKESEIRAVCILALWLTWGILSTLADEELLMRMEQIAENLSRYEGLAQTNINIIRQR